MKTKPFIRIRKRVVTSPVSGYSRWVWLWECTECPPNPRSKVPCGGRHTIRRFSRPSEPDARIRATNAALRHYKLKHTTEEAE
jgi:hypothetical protein